MAFGDFETALRGWMMSTDGDDYCPFCWERLLETMSGVPGFVRDSRPLGEIASSRAVADGWFVVCNSDCGRFVSVGRD